MRTLRPDTEDFLRKNMTVKKNDDDSGGEDDKKIW